jgi:ribosomal protein S6--L-glutamate ligase/tetrahydromethanopterin:alpha-L-glutamate ligase
MKKRGIVPICFRFSNLVARISGKPEVTLDNRLNIIKELSAIIVRPIGRGSLDEIIFNLNILHKLERLGLLIINPPSSIEKAVDKYYTLAILEEHGLPIPRTIVTEDPKNALKAFYELGSDVVVKPIFGSRGIGITRITDPEVAKRIFNALSFSHFVLYVQEYVPHGNKDIRTFVVGDRVVASMHRVANEGVWKTNISQGAKPFPLTPSNEVQSLAVKAIKSIGCEVAGVDLMQGPNGVIIHEVNSQPGFRGLQSTTNVNIAGTIVDYVLERIH